MQNTKNLILMNYKFKKKKNQSHIFNKKHHTIKIITHSILLKIREKKWSKVVLNLGKNFKCD